MKRLACVCMIALIACVSMAQSWKGATFWDKSDGAASVVAKTVYSVPLNRGRYSLELDPFAGVLNRDQRPITGTALALSHTVWRGFGLLAGAAYAVPSGQRPRLGLFVGASANF